MEDFEKKLNRLIDYIHENYTVDVVTLDIIENGIRHLYSITDEETYTNKDFSYYQIYKGLIYGSRLGLNYEEIWDKWMDVIYEDDELIVKSTDTDYDFIATMEVNPEKEDLDKHPGEKLFVIFTGDYEDLKRCEVRTDHWGGILADDNGYATVEALVKGKFYTEWESEFNAEQIEY